MSMETPIQLALPINYRNNEMDIDPLNLFTDEQLEQMRENGKPENHGKDHVPVGFLLSTRTRNQYLLTELSPDHPHLAYGILDIRNVGIDIGFIDLMELARQAILTEQLENPDSLIPDCGAFRGTHKLSEYLKASQIKGFLYTNDSAHLYLVSRYFPSEVRRLDYFEL